jgi:hypothetical protein
MDIVKDAQADPKHHGTMTLYQGRESGVCGVLGPTQEPFEELAVRVRSGGSRAKQRSEAAHEVPELMQAHGPTPSDKRLQTGRDTQQRSAFHFFFQKTSHKK